MGSQFVLHDDEVYPSKLASVFEVEQPTLREKQNKPYWQRVQRPNADALSGEDKVLVMYWQSEWLHVQQCFPSSTFADARDNP